LVPLVYRFSALRTVDENENRDIRSTDFNEKSIAITDFISAKSFLLVKREVAGDATTYNDYRNVDGEMVPFGLVTQSAYLGRIVTKVQEVKFNAPISASAFLPASK
jgi:hypothetical protein